MMKHKTVKPGNAVEEEPASSADSTAGSLVAIEGIDGSGTTSVVDALADSHDIVATAEPAEQFWTGEAARRAINDERTHPMTDLFMFLADRAYHIENTIQPALEDGHTVVTDRYTHSTYAYQQENLRGTVPDPVGFIGQTMENWVRPPDLTILLDLPEHVAAGRRSDGDKYEVSEFQEKVRNNYLRLADGTISAKVVDATQPIEYVIADVEAALWEHL